jgi:sulfide:quinone oxidoreductase
MALRTVVLGAGFGGLELAAILADQAGDDIDLVLVDKAEAFTFGFAKLDVMFGRAKVEQVRHYYRDIVKPGVQFVQSVIRSIDPAAKRVVTDAGTFGADVLVVALGADVDPAATPGLIEGGHEFYTLKGAVAANQALSSFVGGRVVVGVAGRPFKCPPAPSEAVLLLDDYLKARGRRAASEITLVMPFPVPVPPSPDTSKALLATFEERGIEFVKDNFVTALDRAHKIARLSSGSELPYDLFFGIPVHRVPPVVVESGLSSGQDDWIPVDKSTLETKFPGVYAIGDVNGVGTPKAGVFAEGAARVVAARILARLRSGPEPAAYAGKGSCYVEFGDDMVGRVDVDFLSGPAPTSSFQQPSKEMAVEKARFGLSRHRRWFGSKHP